jgi:hypothetical protein
LILKHLGQGRRAQLDVSAYTTTTYNNIANAVPKPTMKLTVLQGNFFWSTLLTLDDNSGIMIGQERKGMKMRKPPKSSTVKGKINAYAYKCGFSFHAQNDGTYALFDIHMGYYVCRGSHDRVVQFVIDELWAKYYRSQSTPV